MRLKTRDPGKLLRNQEPQRYLKKPWSRPLESTEGTEESCNHSKTGKPLASWLGQERTPEWDELGGHRDEKRIAGWSFGAWQSDLGVQPCRQAEGDLLETPVPCVYTNASMTIPPTRQLSYQLICPEEGMPAH